MPRIASVISVSLVPAWLVLVCLTLTSPARAADDPAPQTYPIRLYRPAQVGDVSSFGMVTSRVRTWSSLWDGQNPDNATPGKDSVGGNMAGQMKILEVGKSGREQTVEFRVGLLTSAGDQNDQKELLPPGTIVIARRGKETDFTADNKPVSEDTRRILESIISIPESDESPTADDLYGSDQPHRVGDSWPVHPEVIAKRFSLQGASVDANDVSGTVTLDGVETLDDAPALRIHVHVEVAKFTPPPQTQNPKGVEQYTTSDGSETLDLTYLAPTDPQKSVQLISRELTHKHVGHGRRGAAGYRMDITSRDEMHVSPVTPPAASQPAAATQPADN